jgi:hypothetical protein
MVKLLTPPQSGESLTLDIALVRSESWILGRGIEFVRFPDTLLE